jgi:hypothetical protein
MATDTREIRQLVGVWRLDEDEAVKWSWEKLRERAGSALYKELLKASGPAIVELQESVQQLDHYVSFEDPPYQANLRIQIKITANFEDKK